MHLRVKGKNERRSKEIQERNKTLPKCGGGFHIKLLHHRPPHKSVQNSTELINARHKTNLVDRT